MAMSYGTRLTILLLVVVLVSVPVLLVFSGIIHFGSGTSDPMAEFKAEQDRLKDQAIAVMPELASYGIRELANDAKVGKADPEVILSVTGMDNDGKLRHVRIWFWVAKFRDAEKWECRTIAIDNVVVYNANNARR